MKILGLDVSTSVTGYCIIDDAVPPATGVVHIPMIDAIEFKGCDGLFNKADRAAERLTALRDAHPDITCVALEEPLLGFQKGMSSAATITTLMRFNGIVSYIARGIFKCEPLYISAAHARKLCGIKLQRTSIAGKSQKEQVFDHMSTHDLQHISWPLKKSGKVVDWSRDATDAYVIARAASLQLK